MNVDIPELLIQYGFINFKHEKDSVFDYKFSCYKRVNPPVVCKTNEKLSIVAESWSYMDNESVKLSITAETQDELWVDTSFYALSYTDIDTLDKYNNIEDKLIDSWMSLNGE